MSIVVLESLEEKKLLFQQNILIDSWGRMGDLPGKLGFCIKLQAPRDALKLNCCAFKVLDWLGENNTWGILRFDNSNSMNYRERLIVSQLSVSDLVTKLEKNNVSLFFDFNSLDSSSTDTKIRLAAIIFYCLMVEGHGWVASSHAVNGRYLGIQDGFVYFFSKHEDDTKEAESIINQLEEHPLAIPDWLIIDE